MEGRSFTDIAEGIRPVARRVLIVEDDADIARLVELHLSDIGCTCDIARNGVEGLERALTGVYDLVVLDLTLPELDGIDLCRELRQEKQYTPILMLTSRADEVDRVLGLELGADDYLTKPFSIREFLARVRAVFRRVEALRADTGVDEKATVMRDGLIIDRLNRRVKVRGEKVELTPREYELLLLFALHPGRAFTREEILLTIWGPQFQGYDHTVNSHINRLRSKIEADPTLPYYILTAWGVGYRFVESDERRELP